MIRAHGTCGFPENTVAYKTLVRLGVKGVDGGPSIWFLLALSGGFMIGGFFSPNQPRPRRDRFGALLVRRAFKMGPAYLVVVFARLCVWTSKRGTARRGPRWP